MVTGWATETIPRGNEVMEEDVDLRVLKDGEGGVAGERVSEIISEDSEL